MNPLFLVRQCADTAAVVAVAVGVIALAVAIDLPVVEWALFVTVDWWF